MTTTTKSNTRRRLMIITSDERIIEQIRTYNSPSSFETIVLESDASENELSDLPLSGYNQSANVKKTKVNSLICVVCGSSALGRNFGAIACESCKLFFRRNGLKNPATLFCRFNNECKIKFATRRRCLACRLNKCLSSGMKRDRLLKAEEKAEKRCQLRSQLIHSDHNFQSLSPRNRIYPEQILPRSCQPKRTLLSIRDLERIEAIQIAYEKRIEFAYQEGLPWDPSIFSHNISQHLNARSIPAMRLLAFFKQISEFNQLNLHDKMILIKYNLMTIVILNCALSFDINSKQIIETHTDVPWNSTITRSIHGDQMYMQIAKTFEPLVHIAKYDQKIIHLLLIVLILTKGISTGGGSPEPILNDGMTVYRAQKLYTELLWKYLETIYGFKKAVHIINNLINRFLTWQLIEKKLRDNLQQTFSNTIIDELSPLMKSLYHTL